MLLSSLGNLARNRGQYLAARSYYDQAIEMDRAVAGNGQQVRNENHAKTILNRGNTAMKLGKYKESRDFLEQALSMFYQLYGGKDAKNMDIAIVLCSLANLFRCEKDYMQSEDYYMKSLSMQYSVLGRDAQNANIAETLHCIGMLQQDMDNYDTAKMYQEKALKMIVGTMKNDSSKHPLVQKIAHELVMIEQNGPKQPGMCWVPTKMGKGKRDSTYCSTSKLFD